MQPLQEITIRTRLRTLSAFEEIVARSLLPSDAHPGHTKGMLKKPRIKLTADPIQGLADFVGVGGDDQEFAGRIQYLARRR